MMMTMMMMMVMMIQDYSFLVPTAIDHILTWNQKAAMNWVFGHSGSAGCWKPFAPLTRLTSSGEMARVEALSSPPVPKLLSSWRRRSQLFLGLVS